MSDLSASAAADAALLALRPVVTLALPVAPEDSVSSFLHHTLRPVLKLQNQRLLSTLADFLSDHHVPYAGASGTEQQRLVAELLSRNTKLRYTIIGLVMGMFTEEETIFYRAHRSELNRRILELAIRRAQDQTPTIASLLPRM